MISLHKKAVIGTLFLTLFLDTWNLGLIYPLFTTLLFDAQTSMISSDTSLFWKNALFGIFIAAFPLGQFFGAPLLGRWSDRYGRRMLLIYTLMGSVATLAFCGWAVYANQLWCLVLGRFTGGMMAGNMTLAYSSLADFSDEKTKVRNFALIPLATGLGFAGGPYMAGYLANPLYGSWFGPPLPFLVAALFAVINLGFVIWLFPETLSSPKSQRQESLLTGILNVTQAYSSKTLRPFLSVLFFTLSSNLLFVQFIGAFAFNQFDATVTELGLLYANVGISVAMGHLLFTRQLSKFYSSYRLIFWALLGMGSTLILMPLSPNPALLHLATACMMIFCAIAYTNAMALVSDCGGKDRQGEVMGIAVSIQSAAEFLPPLLTGFVASLHHSVPLLIASLLAFFSCLILSQIPRYAQAATEAPPTTG